MASFFQSEGSSPRVGLRGFSSIPGVDSFILGSIRFRIQISSLVGACRGQPGPAVGSHGSQRGKATSPRSYREADEGRIRTRAPLLDALFASNHLALHVEFHTSLTHFSHRSDSATLIRSYTDRHSTC